MCISIHGLGTHERARRGYDAGDLDKSKASLHRRRGSMSGELSAGAVLLSSSSRAEVVWGAVLEVGLQAEGPLVTVDKYECLRGWGGFGRLP